MQVCEHLHTVIKSSVKNMRVKDASSDLLKYLKNISSLLQSGLCYDHFINISISNNKLLVTKFITCVLMDTWIVPMHWHWDQWQCQLH